MIRLTGPGRETSRGHLARLDQAYFAGYAFWNYLTLPALLLRPDVEWTLEVDLGRILVVAGDTARTPNEQYTAGSMSMETSGKAIRHAGAEARH